MLRKAYTRTLLGFIIIRIRYSSFLSPDPFLLSVSLRRDTDIDRYRLTVIFLAIVVSFVSVFDKYYIRAFVYSS